MSTVEQLERRLRLNQESLERIRAELETLKRENEPDFVQVRYLGSVASLYTYIDPGFGLKTGDIVVVSNKYRSHILAYVANVGRSMDGYPGPFSEVEYIIGRNDGTRVVVVV
jgi:hypothetical protein